MREAQSITKNPGTQARKPKFKSTSKDKCCTKLSISEARTVPTATISSKQSPSSTVSATEPPTEDTSASTIPRRASSATVPRCSYRAAIRSRIHTTIGSRTACAAITWHAIDTAVARHSPTPTVPWHNIRCTRSVISIVIVGSVVVVISIIATIAPGLLLEEGSELSHSFQIRVHRLPVLTGLGLCWWNLHGHWSGGGMSLWYRQGCDCVGCWAMRMGLRYWRGHKVGGLRACGGLRVHCWRGGVMHCWRRGGYCLADWEGIMGHHWRGSWMHNWWGDLLPYRW